MHARGQPIFNKLKIVLYICNCSEAGAKNSSCSGEARLSVVGAIGCYCKKKSGGVVAAKRVVVAAKRSERKDAATKRGGREELQLGGKKLHLRS